MVVILLFCLLLAPLNISADDWFALEDNLFVIEEDGECRLAGYYKLTNNGESTKRLSNLSMDIEDADGKIVNVFENIGITDVIVSPGESTYIFTIFRPELRDGMAPEDCNVKLKVKSEDAAEDLHEFEVSYDNIYANNIGLPEVLGRFKNDTENKTICTVCITLENEQGELRGATCMDYPADAGEEVSFDIVVNQFIETIEGEHLYCNIYARGAA